MNVSNATLKLLEKFSSSVALSSFHSFVNCRTHYLHIIRGSLETCKATVKQALRMIIPAVLDHHYYT